MNFAGARWFKSSKSGDRDCVEVAFIPDHVGVRDSKNIDSGSLVIPNLAWQAFVDNITNGEFDRP